MNSPTTAPAPPQPRPRRMQSRRHPRRWRSLVACNSDCRAYCEGGSVPDKAMGTAQPDGHCCCLRKAAQTGERYRKNTKKIVLGLVLLAANMSGAAPTGTVRAVLFGRRQPVGGCTVAIMCHSRTRVERWLQEVNSNAPTRAVGVPMTATLGMQRTPCRSKEVVCRHTYVS